MAVLLAMTACTGAGHPDASVTRVLQAVEVTLAGDGAITAIDGTAISLDDVDGSTRSERTSYRTEDVVDDLPVRISTEYRTEERRGTNLEDLAGYTGQVEIDIQLENLTLKPTELSYDVGGESRNALALVGTPLSVAAATTLPGVDPSAIVMGEAGEGTSGVVSTTPDGDAAVQWAALLAPPQTEARETFTLVADVKDFSVPEFDVAVQAGLNTDLSFDGVVTSAFDGDGTSELAIQRQAITLIAEINEVLNRAGTTITEVRTNLEDTSTTLGQRAARNLEASSRALTADMQVVGQQLSSLDRQLESSVSGTESAMTAQLAQIVGSMSAMLGDTRAQAPRFEPGDGCDAAPEQDPEAGTIFGMFLLLSGQLEAYAEGAESCRGLILTQIDRSLGPEAPNQDVCVGDTEDSLTCALFRAHTSVNIAAADLVAEGERLIEELDGAAVTRTQEAHESLRVRIDNVAAEVAELETSDAPAELETLLADLRRMLENAESTVTSIDTIRVQQAAAVQMLQPEDPVLRQHMQIANTICDLVDAGDLNQGTARGLLQQIIVPTWCDDRAALNPVPEDPENPENPEGPVDPVEPVEPVEIPAAPGSLEAERRTHLERWITVGDMLDPENAASVDAQLARLVTELERRVAEVHRLAELAASETAELHRGITELRASINDVQLLSEEVDGRLADVAEQQTELEQSIRAGFERTAERMADSVEHETDQQIARVSARVERDKEQIADSFTTLVTQLRGTSRVMVNSAREGVDAQHERLQSTETSAVQALDERTTDALSRIDHAVAGATADIDGASAQLTDSLSRVLLDLGDPQVQGSGILGAMSASAAKSGTADYQLALASQQAAGFANVQSEAATEVFLRQAQFAAALAAAEDFPAFHLDVPAGASSRTLYSFHIGGEAE